MQAEQTAAGGGPAALLSAKDREEIQEEVALRVQQMQASLAGGVPFGPPQPQARHVSSAASPLHSLLLPHPSCFSLALAPAASPSHSHLLLLPFKRIRHCLSVVWT